jgi:hypothetical protein
MITDGNDINIASYRLAKTARGNTPKTDPKAIQTKRDIEILKNEEKIPIIINTLDEIDTLIYSIMDKTQADRGMRARLRGGVLPDFPTEQLISEDEDSEATTVRQLISEDEFDDEDLYETGSSDYTYEGPPSGEGTLSDISRNIPIGTMPIGTMDYNIIRFQEKVNRLSLLTRELNKIINFSSPIIIEELKEINQKVTISNEELTMELQDSHYEPEIKRIQNKLTKENKKIKSAVNSYTGNFLGGAVFNSSGMGNTMGEIYRQSPRKRFF